MGANHLVPKARLLPPLFQHHTTTGSILLLMQAAACATPPSPDAGKAHVEVQWNGSKSGSMEGEGVAEWCAPRRLLQISLVQGDTGMALALYPNDSVASGVYPVIDPARAESTPPAAGLAVRWLAATTVQGFQGDSGRVNLDRSATGRLSGRLGARARSVVDTQRIRLTGTFRNLTVVQDTLGCAPADTAEEESDPEDIGVDDTGVD
jgi:hypothetical protein